MTFGMTMGLYGPIISSNGQQSPSGISRECSQPSGAPKRQTYGRSSGWKIGRQARSLGMRVRLREEDNRQVPQLDANQRGYSVVWMSQARNIIAAKGNPLEQRKILLHRHARWRGAGLQAKTQLGKSRLAHQGQQVRKVWMARSDLRCPPQGCARQRGEAHHIQCLDSLPQLPSRISQDGRPS